MPKVGIIAAMRREIWPLVRSWKRRKLAYSGRSFELFEGGLAYALVAGIGAEPARLGAEALVKEFGLDVLISAGFAGALTPGMPVGDPVTAGTVVDAASGETFSALFGLSVLVTSTSVLREAEKVELFAKYGGHAVDMEAASVARVARRHGMGFLAVKGISETHDFPMPPVERFVGSEGQFHAARFALHAAVRPWTWSAVATLAAGNRRAAMAVCRVLDGLIHIEDLRAVKAGKGELRTTAR